MFTNEVVGDPVGDEVVGDNTEMVINSAAQIPNRRCGGYCMGSEGCEDSIAV
jgi:hypothetical protein